MKKAIDVFSLLLVSAIVAIGIFTSMQNNNSVSWAEDSEIQTNNKPITRGNTFIWKEKIEENSKGFEQIEFDTTNGTIVISPQEENVDTIELFVETKIRKGWFGSESKVLKTKEKTGVDVTSKKKILQFQAKHPSRNPMGISSITINLVAKIPANIPLVAKTTNGKIDIEKINASVETRTTNGEIIVKECMGAAKASTTNGSISLKQIQNGFYTKSVNGQIFIEMVSGLDQDSKAETTNGAITIVTPNLYHADIDISTLNGSVSIKNKQFHGEKKRTSAVGRIGDGGKKISCRAVNGAITIQ